MLVEGYKLNGYNATYEKVLLDVKSGYNLEKNCVLEVTDTDSGITFIFEYGVEKARTKTKSMTRVWRSDGK